MASVFIYTGDVEKELTKKDKVSLYNILSVDLPYGYARTLYKCTHCDKIMSSVYIPFGLSRGGSQNECGCMITSNNFSTLSTTIEIGTQEASYKSDD